jgi:hypothetical protein
MGFCYFYARKKHYNDNHENALKIRVGSWWMRGSLGRIKIWEKNCQIDFKGWKLGW